MRGHTDKAERTSYYFDIQVDLKEAGHAGINPLAPELNIYSLAHHLRKM